MDILATFFDAAWRLGIPVALLSFGMVWWALHRGFVEGEDSVKSLEKEITALGKSRKKDDAPKLNPLHTKWFKFGGGFYGITALYTYILIEWDEVLDFIGGLGDLIFRLDISILINFFINSLMNFIGAITWPLYWMNRSESADFWVWFVVAYGGYWVGMSAARKYSGMGSGESGSGFWNDDGDDPD